MSLLQVYHLNLQEAGNTVLQDINFTQKEFQKIALAGETGSGKSTLLQSIAGLVQPTSGQIQFEQKKVKGPQDQLVPGHPGIAYLSQQYELPRFLRVEQILAYANQLTDSEASTLYEVCRINHLLHRRTDHLSGGERQRIALARLLLSAPRLLLLDEPYSNLDSSHKNILKTVIRDISASLELTCILISHDPLDTLSWADKIIVMQQGQICQQGTPAQIYQQPVNEYTAALFGRYNLISAGKAHVFGITTEIIPAGKNILIRPESFRIMPDPAPDQAISGKIKKVTYFGSYQEVEVAYKGLNLAIRTNVSPITSGAKISVAFSPEAVWYV